MAVQNNIDIDDFLKDPNKAYPIRKKVQVDQSQQQKIYTNICQVSLPPEYLFETQFAQITQLVNDSIVQLELIKRQDEKAPAVISKENNILIKGTLQQLGQSVQNACQNLEQKLQMDAIAKGANNQGELVLEQIEKYSNEVDLYVQTLNKTLELERELARKTEALLRIREENQHLEELVQYNDKTLEIINRAINNSDSGEQIEVAKAIFKDMEVDLPQFSDQDGDDDFWAEINDDNTQTGASELETGGMHGEGSP